MQNPRETFLSDRATARGGEVVYDGDRFQLALTRASQDRVDALCAEWNVPRSNMVRWLVDTAIEQLDNGSHPRSGKRRRRSPAPR
jgi:hypothetical protein